MNLVDGYSSDSKVQSTSLASAHLSLSTSSSAGTGDAISATAIGILSGASEVTASGTTTLAATHPIQDPQGTASRTTEVATAILIPTKQAEEKEITSETKAEIAHFANLSNAATGKNKDHAILKDQIIDIKLVGGTSAKSGVYIVTTARKDEETNEVKIKKWIVKPADQAQSCYDNPRGNDTTKMVQVQAGIFKDQPVLHEAVCSQLAKASGFEYLTPDIDLVGLNLSLEKFAPLRGLISRQKGIVQHEVLCSVQPFFEGKTLERSFRDLAKERLSTKLVKNLSDIPVADRINNNLITLESGTISEVQQVLKNERVIKSVETQLNAIIATIYDNDFEDVIIFNLMIAEQDGNLGNFLISKEIMEEKEVSRLRKIDNGGALGPKHGHIEAGLDNLSEHDKYEQPLSDRFKEKVRAFDDDKIVQLVKIMNAGGMSDVACKKLQDRLELMRNLVEVEGMTPKAFIDLMQDSNILKLKEKGFDLIPLFGNELTIEAKNNFLSLPLTLATEEDLKFLKLVKELITVENMTPKKLIAIMRHPFVISLWEKEHDITPLFTKEWKDSAAAFFSRFPFEEITDERDLKFMRVAHGMTLDKDWGVDDLYMYWSLPLEKINELSQASIDSQAK